MEPDLRQAEQLVLELLTIPGRSCQEREVAEFVVQKLLEVGIPAEFVHFDSAHQRTPEPGQVGNLVLRLPGRQGRPRRLLSAHLDTVPICVGCRPVRQRRMVRSRDAHTGLGADNRAGCAVILTAAREIWRRQLPHPPLTFCWFVQEEIGLQGSRCVDRRLLGKPRLAFNWDGGSPTKLTIGATGGYRMRINVRGIASHAGGAPQWGVSAITIASLAIADLHRRGWLGEIRKSSRRGTANVGVIRGGEATNVVADSVMLQAEARSHDPSFRERIVQEIVQAFERAAAKVRNVAGAAGEVAVDGRLDYEAFQLPRDDPSVVAAAAAVQDLGAEPEWAIADGGLDANWLIQHGIPTVSLGCGQLNQHMVTEALDLDAFGTACRIALRLAVAAD